MAHTVSACMHVLLPLSLLQFQNKGQCMPLQPRALQQAQPGRQWRVPVSTCSSLVLPYLQEANILQDCAHHFIKYCKVQPGQLGVITPYVAQAALIRQGLQEQGCNVNGFVSCGSLENQHGECAGCQPTVVATVDLPVVCFSVSTTGCAAMLQACDH